ncbi:unnamed protein product [Heterobilharzia americana]|nr:unnamed protein product [Heterobilharzia americana]
MQQVSVGVETKANIFKDGFSGSATLVILGVRLSYLFSKEWTNCYKKDTIYLRNYLETRAEQAEEKVASLTKEVELAKKRESDLQEQLNIYTTKVDSFFECATNAGVNDELGDEINRLQSELSDLKSSSRMEKSKLELQIQELEGDRQHMEEYANELIRQLKDCRSELNDTRAQFEALQIQANSTECTRGNSVFSEIEDRRIQAECLVVKLRKEISELKLSIFQMKAENKRKFTETVQKLELRHRNQDKKLLRDVEAEQEHLITENTKLSKLVQLLKDLQLDHELGVLKVAEVRGNSQAAITSLLEERVKDLKRAYEESHETITRLRRRLFVSGQIRQTLQDELCYRVDQIASLSSKLNALKKIANSARKCDCQNQSHHLETEEKQSSSSLADKITKLDLDRSPNELVADETFYNGELSKTENPVELPLNCDGHEYSDQSVTYPEDMKKNNVSVECPTS